MSRLHNNTRKCNNILHAVAPNRTAGVVVPGITPKPIKRIGVPSGSLNLVARRRSVFARSGPQFCKLTTINIQFRQRKTNYRAAVTLAPRPFQNDPPAGRNNALTLFPPASYNPVIPQYTGCGKAKEFFINFVNLRHNKSAEPYPVFKPQNPGCGYLEPAQIGVTDFEGSPAPGFLTPKLWKMKKPGD